MTFPEMIEKVGSFVFPDNAAYVSITFERLDDAKLFGKILSRYEYKYCLYSNKFDYELKFWPKKAHDKRVSIVSAMKELRELTSAYWDNFNTNDEINRELGRD